ncbi:MAG: GIY-YIG nuclease family protein [Bacteriovoracales bacterium]
MEIILNNSPFWNSLPKQFIGIYRGIPKDSPRQIYAISFPDNSVYFGLTNQKISARLYGHKNSNFLKLREKFQTFGDDFKIYLTYFMDVNEARKMETDLINKYEETLEVLNRIKGGGIGGSRVGWTPRKVYKLSRLCKTKTEFNTKYPGACQAARKLGIYNKATSHMKILRVHWIGNKKKIKEVAKKSRSITEFIRKYPDAFHEAKRLGIFDKVTSHINKRREFANNPKEVRRVASLCKTKSEFNKKYFGAWRAAKRLGIFDEITAKMEKKVIFWMEVPIKEILNVARSCKTKTEFERNHTGAWEAAKKRGIYEEATSHMFINNWLKKPEEILKVAKLCKNRTEFKNRFTRAYFASKKLGIIGIATSHMPKTPQKKYH